MLKLWTFIGGCVSVYGARPNFICYIFGVGVTERLASTLFISAQTVASIANIATIDVYLLLQFSQFKWRINI